MSSSAVRPSGEDGGARTSLAGRIRAIADLRGFGPDALEKNRPPGSFQHTEIGFPGILAAGRLPAEVYVTTSLIDPHRFDTRRRFLGATLATMAGSVLASDFTVQAQLARPGMAAPRLLKAVKWGMVDVPGSVLEKFEVQQQLGFDGVELNSPSDLGLEEARLASDKTGMPIHGVVDSVHWEQRLSSPDAATRDRGRGALLQALRDTYHWHGSAVLLVPGRVGERESHDEVWQRSIVEIKKVLPWASRWGVRILIENVWNGFCETPEQLRDYVDEIASPWVGVYFDIGNARKFGPSENWIRTLGRRIVKLDVKDWGVANGFCKIGDGDVNWPEVRAALQEVGYVGWCTAEVAGGGVDRLREIAERMDEHLLSLNNT